MVKTMTRTEIHDWLNASETWREYQKRYTSLQRSIPNDIGRAKSWTQIEEWPHLMFQLMVCYKGLWYWDSKGFIA